MNEHVGFWSSAQSVCAPYGKRLVARPKAIVRLLICSQKSLGSA
jgi:hypothetical protein